MRASKKDRTSRDSGATPLLQNPQASQDQGRTGDEVYPVEPHQVRRRLHSVKLLGLSPLTHFVLMLVAPLLIVYLLRDPLDRVLPGFKDAVDSAVSRSSETISRTAGSLSGAASKLYVAGLRTVSPYVDGASPPASDGSARVVRVPYYSRIPTRPRLTVSTAYKSQSLGSRECEERCYLVRMPDDSLAPTIKKGQMLLIDSGRKPVAGEVVWAAYQSRPYLRRYFPAEGFVRLAPDNRSYPEIRVAQKQVEVFGVFLRTVE